jgi:hypothetical protein
LRRTERKLFSVSPNEIYRLDWTQPGKVYFTQTIHRSRLWMGHFAR